MTHPPTPPVQKKNPLHGVTLERMLNELVEYFGWETMADRIPVRCFTSDPSVKSSLAFLRKTPWAREKVEGMFLYMQRDKVRAARMAAGASDASAANEPRDD